MDGQSGSRIGGILGLIGGALGVLVVLLLLLGLAMWPFAKTPRDEVGLSYGGGFFEGAHFQGIIQPGHGLFFNGFGDSLYEYPVTQRNYIITKDPTIGDLKKSDFVAAPSQDRIEVDYEVAVYFKLNTSLIQQFHETIGLKYHAWDTEGWDKMLLDTFRPQIEFAIQRESRKYPVADIYSDAQTLLAIQHDVGTVLKENINGVLGADYFCGTQYVQGSSVCPDFTFVIKHITVPEGVQKAFQDNRTSEIEILTRENEVKQAQLEAQAIHERQQALESCGQTYEAIHQGGITFWVLPDGTPLVAPTPGGKP